MAKLVLRGCGMPKNEKIRVYLYELFFALIACLLLLCLLLFFLLEADGELQHYIN